MSKLSKFSILFFILVFIGLSIYVYLVFSNRNSSPNVDKPYESSSQQENPSVTLPNDSQPAEQESNDDTEPATPAKEKTPLVEIEKEDCLNGCKRFSENQEFVYCKQFCGAVEIQINTSDCSEKSGLEKDYCYKDAAINAKDLKACEKVSDRGIKRTCITRITEDILDSRL